MVFGLVRAVFSAWSFGGTAWANKFAPTVWAVATGSRGFCRGELVRPGAIGGASSGE